MTQSDRPGASLVSRRATIMAGAAGAAALAAQLPAAATATATEAASKHTVNIATEPQASLGQRMHEQVVAWELKHGINITCEGYARTDTAGLAFEVDAAGYKHLRMSNLIDFEKVGAAPGVEGVWVPLFSGVRVTVPGTALAA